MQVSDEWTSNEAKRSAGDDFPNLRSLRFFLDGRGSERCVPCEANIMDNRVSALSSEAVDLAKFGRNR